MKSRGKRFQLTAARRRLAADRKPHLNAGRKSFNSQPPEGGWLFRARQWKPIMGFQLTAARRRLVFILPGCFWHRMFQLTAARRRLGYAAIGSVKKSSFQLTAARRRLEFQNHTKQVNKMFQLTAARRRLEAILIGRLGRDPVSTHSRPKAAGAVTAKSMPAGLVFQLTAARRRLGRKTPGAWR